jgi:hypothetical protein
MATLNIDLYDALKEAKVSEERARAAATALSETSRLASEQSEMKLDIKQLKSDVQVLKMDVALMKWMIGFNLAATMAILWKMLR